MSSTATTFLRANIGLTLGPELVLGLILGLGRVSAKVRARAKAKVRARIYTVTLGESLQ